MRRPAKLATVVAAFVVLSEVVASVTAGTSPCPQQVDAGGFATPAKLREWNAVMADLGPRPTASPAHEAFIAWLEARLGQLPGIELSAMPDEIERQLETGASIEVTTPGGPRPLAVAASVPYAAPAPDEVTAPLIYLPPGTAITAADVRGRIVVRDALPSSSPMLLFLAVGYYVHDPDLTFDLTGNYERDWLAAAARITDLEHAQQGGAAGLVFVHEFPRDQVEGHYSPYPGVDWQIPAIYLGVDEGTELKQLATTGEPTTATLSLTATRQLAPTRTVIARLPGQSDERIVIESHTDGMNAVWDNGPIAILALAEWFAGVPLACRPRTLEFVFTTSHLYLSHLGAERYAAHLDHEYDHGNVALVVALEHLGAREFEAVPRGDGPGRRLQLTGRSELFATFVIESPVLIAALVDDVVKHDLRRTWVLRGADAPQIGLPPHRSYGGEGGPYREHLIPTVAAITGPWTLFNPAFEMDELVDFELMHRQTLAFGDVVLTVDDVPRLAIAGLDTVYRLGRDLLGDFPPIPILPPSST